jgi:predicted outer membrane repeat protein
MTANDLAERPQVRFAEPDGIFSGRGAYTPNDPCFPEGWGIHNTGQGGGIADKDMDGPEGWDVTTGDPCVIVVIFDCGVDQSHPDIHQIPGKDFTGEGGGGGPFKSNDNHGTAVAGCVSAIIDNGLGTVGIAPDCRVFSARVYSTRSDGDWDGEASDMVDALAWAVGIGAKVTNNSNIYFSGSSIIAQKYAETRVNGIIHFASAGNQRKNKIGWPASLASVNAITAINRYGSLWFQGTGVGSNWGSGVAFTAPGQDIWTTDISGSTGYNPGDYHLGTGTSYASPYAAGVAALVLSCNPSLSPEQVEKYVDDNAPGDPGQGDPTVSDPNEDGSSDHPFDAIQEAIDVICGPGLVVVRDGTYTGTGNKNIDFGGKTITLKSENGAEVTTIDCENTVRGFYFHHGEGPESVVDGFKIINGFGAPGLGYGGGIWCSYSSPTIANCTISNCSAAISTSQGGGMSNFYCNPTVTNCVFSYNSSNWGAGMSNQESNPIVTNCIFNNNLAAREGGGIYNYDSNDVMLINCTFNGNRANESGGGVKNIGWSEPKLINCTFSGNSASYGGGMFNSYSEPKLFNCTFSGNLADDYGGGICNYSSSSQTLNNCILWCNSAPSGPEIYDDAASSSTVSYSDVKGSYPGTGNKDTDPCFLRLPNDGGDGWGDDPATGGIDEGANDDFGNLHLSPGSPCIGAGDNTAVPQDVADIDSDGDTLEPTPWDLDGNPRIVSGTVDMGAYEFQGILYVDDDASNDPGHGDSTVSDPNENGSAEHPFDAIQEAIDIAHNGDTAMVLDGTYRGTGNKNIDFGGKAITVRSKNGPKVTVIDCENLDRGFYFHSGEGGYSIVAGLTITDGNVSPHNGGGILCDNSSPTIINCIISGNTAGTFGGGMFCTNNSFPEIINCVFSGNKTVPGGPGGGIACVFYGNPTLSNCTFSGNSSKSFGGGLYCMQMSYASVLNCIFHDNTAAYGPQIAIVEASDVAIGYTNLPGSQPAIYKDYNSHIIWYPGNIDLDPMLMEDGHLRSGSPCIDAGNNTLVPADFADLDNDDNTFEPLPFDLDNHPRIADGDCNDTTIVDMGAYEFDYAYAGDFDSQCDVDFVDYAIFALAWLTEPGDAQWNPACDISVPADNHIDWNDFDVFANNWLAGK